MNFKALLRDFSVYVATIVFIILLTILLTNTVFAASCFNPNETASVKKTFKWVAATEREDNVKFPASENGGYKIYYNNKTDNCAGSDRITDKNTLTKAYYLLENKDYDFTITQWDTGSRESKHSFPVVSVRIDSSPIVTPLTIKPKPPVFILTRVGETMTWQLELDAVTTDVEGNPVTPIKYFLFDNDKWIKDVYIDKTYTFDLVAGTAHNYMMQTEIKSSPKNIVSELTSMFTVNAEVYVAPIAPPKPPMIIDVPPEGVILNQPVLITPAN